MAVLKQIRGKYIDPDSLTRVADYIIRGGKYYGTFNLNPYTVQLQMRAVKTVWYSTSGIQLHHFVVSLDKSESVEHGNALLFWDTAHQIASFFSPAYQVLYGIHDKPEQLHLHIMINSIAFTNGKRYPDNETELRKYRDFIRSILRTKVNIRYG